MTTTFIETPRFPENISYGSTGGPGFNTDVVFVSSGFENTNQNWAQSKCEFEASHGLKTQAQLDDLVTFFRICAGRATFFRYKDWSDFSVTTSQGRISTAAVGDGTPGPMQLVKRYTWGSYTTDRLIKKPTASPAPSVYRAGVLKTLTTHYTMDLLGNVTWGSDASSSASSITPGATTQVVLGANPGTLIAGQKIYLTGFAGTDAALVNNLAHTINSVSGSGPYTFTLATVTTGKTITLGSGAGAKYPQATEALTWSGEFDVPCRFDTDKMKVSLAFYQGFEWSQIPIVEVRL